MATPKDIQRVAAFRAWVKAIGGIERVEDHIPISLRTLQRMLGGKQPPPTRLLDAIAASIDTHDPGTPDYLPMRLVADQLRTAAQPMEATDA